MRVGVPIEAFASHLEPSGRLTYCTNYDISRRSATTCPEAESVVKHGAGTSGGPNRNRGELRESDDPGEPDPWVRVAATHPARIQNYPSIAWTGSEYAIAWGDYLDREEVAYVAMIAPCR